MKQLVSVFSLSPAIGVFIGIIVLLACGNGNQHNSDKKKSYDTPRKGRIVISVDESFKPIIDSQIKVYKASNPESEIVAYYKPEAECLRDLELDSVRMVIVTRGLTKAESDGFHEKIRFRPSYGMLAYDAIAVVGNTKSGTNVLSMLELRNMLNGSVGGDYQIVMDGLTATSTVRFAIDSIIKGGALGSKVVAAKSSAEVLDYVGKTVNAIGLIGVSWVGDRDDDTQLSFKEGVKLISMKCETCPEEAYVLPYQANIALGRYPLIRGIHYILKENYEGLGRGFVNFLLYERGQLIFKRAYLLPARMQFGVRDMKVVQ